MGELFKNPTEKTQPAPAPDWVVNELVNKFRLNIHAVRRMGAKRAFAILYRMRDRGDPIEAAKERRRKLRDKIGKAVANEDTTAEQMTSLLSEAFVNLDCSQLNELGKFAVLLLAPPDTESEGV